MAKRMQEQEGEDRIVAKSKPTMNLAFTVSTSSSTVQNPIASKRPGTLKALCRKDWKSTGELVAREPNQDAASSSQVWQTDAEMDKSTTRLVVAEKDQELANFQKNLKSTRKHIAPANSDIDGNGTIRPHNLHISTVYVPLLEKVFSNVRWRYGLEPGGKMENLEENAIIW